MCPSVTIEPTRALTISLTFLFLTFSAPPEMDPLPAPLLASQLIETCSPHGLVTDPIFKDFWVVTLVTIVLFQ